MVSIFIIKIEDIETKAKKASLARIVCTLKASMHLPVTFVKNLFKRMQAITNRTHSARWFGPKANFNYFLL